MNNVIIIMIHPITFSIPEEKICVCTPVKDKLLSSLLPGVMSTYIYTTEHDYYNEYKRSYFAITTKKAGWDCMRHYEILANGCIPYFPDIELCPPNTMALFPKELIIQGNLLYNKIKSYSNDVPNDEDLQLYLTLRDKLLDYTREYLTTCKMATYVLEKANMSSSNNILYLSGDTSPDYLRCVTLHGFKSLYGTKCHDYPKIPHIYKSNDIRYDALYGRGITYTNLLDSTMRDDSLDETIENRIKSKQFDCIVYGSYHRGMPYIDLISTIYKPNEIILLCGEDIHACNYTEGVRRGYHVFVREL